MAGLGKPPDKTPTLILMALLAAMTSPAIKAAEIQTSIPLPEWKTPAQLAAWSEALHQKALAKEAAQAAASRPSTVDASTSSLNSGVPTPLAPPQGSGAARSSQSNQLPPVAGFYTGKPYLAESGSYAFKYREYNPETTRWTTVDPSGFPDGANNRLYAASPTSEFDPTGFSVQNLALQIPISYQIKLTTPYYSPDGTQEVEYDSYTTISTTVDLAYSITTTPGAPHQSISVGGWSYDKAPISTFVAQNLLNGWSVWGFNLDLADNFTFQVSNTTTAQGHPEADIAWQYSSGASLSWSVGKGSVTSPLKISLASATQVASGKSSIIAE
jgi:RHS repeat-associated protein